MVSGTSFLSEAELHGLVDGQIEAERRADVLRRAAKSVIDRERIEAWQGQAELIRAAFRGIDKEVVPPALDLQPPVRLLCLPPALAARSEAADVAPLTVVVSDRPKMWRLAVAGLTVLVVGGGLFVTARVSGMWPSGHFAMQSKSAELLSGTVEDVLAGRTAGALAATLESSAPAKPVAMPTTSIPDLTSIGFTLSGAKSQVGELVSLVFRYRNAADEQIVIGVARAPGEWRQGVPGAFDDVVVWRVGGKAYAIGGTLRPDRLRAIAASLRDEAIEE